MAKQTNILNFEEIRFRTSASPATKIDKATASRIAKFRDRHERRGALTLAAFNS